MVGVIDHLNSLDAHTRAVYDQFHALYKCATPVKASAALEKLLSSLPDQTVVQSRNKAFLMWTWKEYELTSNGQKALQAERDWVKDLDLRATPLYLRTMSPHLQCRYILSKALLDGTLDAAPLGFFTATGRVGDAVREYAIKGSHGWWYKALLAVPQTQTSGSTQGDSWGGYGHCHGFGDVGMGCHGGHGEAHGYGGDHGGCGGGGDCGP
ncbi:hypothetical protein HY642_01180 [Candidatus Woesearchaeota archaeon]|nr:hypothetical protein [Candidatus Woesearchaeota archaeon]